MTIEDILSDAKRVVKQVVPDHVEITAIDFEGPTIVIYTKNIEIFAESNDLVRQIAQQLRRRIIVRPDPSLLSPSEDAERVIRETIPAEAQITGIFFETETGEVTIEALAPGMVIGRHGAVLNEIKKKIGWAPKVVRTPPIPSKTVDEIRQYLRTIQDDRQQFLKTVGRKLAREVPAGENYVRLTALGGFRQVGRSAALLSTRESKVLIDCGVLISEDNGSPYLNAPEVMPLSSIDALVITHAPLDHSGLVPALYKYGYEGPIYCTPPTRDLMSLLQLDFIKVAMGEARKLVHRGVEEPCLLELDVPGHRDVVQPVADVEVGDRRSEDVPRVLEREADVRGDVRRLAVLQGDRVRHGLPDVRGFVGGLPGLAHGHLDEIELEEGHEVPRRRGRVDRALVAVLVQGRDEPRVV